MIQNVQITSYNANGNPPTGQFTIYYGIGSNIFVADLNYPPYPPATGITYSLFFPSGIDVIIPDNSTKLILKDTTPCSGTKCCNKSVEFTLTPIEEPIYLCINGDIRLNNGPNVINITVGPTTLIPNGTFNGKDAWISIDGNYAIIWDINENRWVYSSSTLTSYTIVSDVGLDSPISDSWNVYDENLVGSPIITVKEGTCEAQNLNNVIPFSVLKTLFNGSPLSFNNTLNQTICGCDGSITMTAQGGYPPYTYSIDNGLTYQSFPIYNNLCSGIYSISVKDSYGTTVNESVILNEPTIPTTYVISPQITTSIISYTNTSITKKYETRFIVTPSLPEGITINFNVNHLHTSKSSPNIGSFSSNTNTEFLVNSSPLLPDITLTETGTTLSTIDGCQLNNVYITSVNESWNNVTLTNSDELILTTITTDTQNESIVCYFGSSEERYFVTNPTVGGCSCCSVITI